MAFDDELTVLSPVVPDGPLTTLYTSHTGRFIGDVDLHFSGERLLFSSIGTHNRWQIHEMSIADGNLRQLTPGKEEDVDNYDACYLPNGDVIFSSTACFKGVPCVKGSDHVANLYVMDERVQYYGPDGKLITESMRDYTRACVTKQFASLDDFLRKWSDADQKKAIIKQLEEEGVFWEPLSMEVERKLGKQFDPFDLICHVAYGRPPLSRKERADNVRKRDYFTKYGDQARKVLEALLDKYADTGIENIEDLKVLQLEPFSQMGTAPEIVKSFGGKPEYLKALKELEEVLYA